MGDKQGSNILAANALMMQLVLMAAYGMDGFAFAVEALSGNRLGARDLAGFYKVVRYCSLWCGITAICMSLVFLLFHNPLYAIMTNMAPLRELLVLYTPWLILLPLVAAPSYLLDGVFIGSAETRDMMVSMLFSVFIIYLPTWFFYSPSGEPWTVAGILRVQRGQGCHLVSCLPEKKPAEEMAFAHLSFNCTERAEICP